MSDYSLPGYDTWKTMSPDKSENACATTFLRGECDCCGEDKPQLWRIVTAHNIETFACAECCQANDDAEDDR